MATTTQAGPPTPPVHDGPRIRDLERLERYVIPKGFPRRQVQAILHGKRELYEHQLPWWEAIVRTMHKGAISILWGGRGKGKTHLACHAGLTWYSYCWHEVNGAARYYRLNELMNRHVNWCRMEPHKRSGDAPLDEAAGCGLLVLDEMHEGTGSDWQVSSIVTLLDQRYASQMPTLLLTNHTPEDLGKHVIGYSALDRVKEGGSIIGTGDAPNVRDEKIGGGA